MAPSNAFQDHSSPRKEGNILLNVVKQEEWTTAESFLETACARDIIGYRDDFGNSLLHIALGFKAPDDFLLKLIEMDPEATQVSGVDGWYPLHVAAMWGCSSVVLDALIRHYPEALDISSDNGRTPRQFSDRFAHNKVALERTTVEWLSIIRIKRRKPQHSV